MMLGLKTAGSFYGCPIFLILIAFNYYYPAFNNDPTGQFHLSMMVLGFILIGVYFNIFGT